MAVTYREFMRLLTKKCGFTEVSPSGTIRNFERQADGKIVRIAVHYHPRDIDPGPTAELAARVGFPDTRTMEHAASCKIDAKTCDTYVRERIEEGGRYVRSAKRAD